MYLSSSQLKDAIQCFTFFYMFHETLKFLIFVKRKR